MAAQRATARETLTQRVWALGNWKPPFLKEPNTDRQGQEKGSKTRTVHLSTNLNYKVITLHVNEISVKEREYFIREPGIV